MLGPRLDPSSNNVLIGRRWELPEPVESPAYAFETAHPYVIRQVLPRVTHSVSLCRREVPGLHRGDLVQSRQLGIRSFRWHVRSSVQMAMSIVSLILFDRRSTVKLDQLPGGHSPNYQAQDYLSPSPSRFSSTRLPYDMA